ncbi:DUF726-domain-containing protein [Hypoxylon crocopeplum]|nr:DUF726-domain-containing protein [Hypoxylon crocopeplum]
MDNLFNFSSSSEDEIQAMAPNRSGKGRNAQRPKLNLSAVMNVEQRSQLLELINNIADDMEKQIRDNYDLTPIQVNPDLGIEPPKAIFMTIPNPRSEKYRHMYADTALGPDQSTSTNTDAGQKNVPPTRQPGTTPGASQPLWTIPKSPEEAAKMYGKTEKDLLLSSVSDLKGSALGHFNKWRAIMQKRIEDISITGAGTTGNIAGQETQFLGNAGRPGNVATGRSLPSGPNPCAGNANATLLELHPQISNPLGNGPREKRVLILHSILLILLGLDSYPAYSRILLLKLATSLDIPMWVFSTDEIRVARALSQIIKGIPAEEIAQKRMEESRSSRRWKAGMAGAAQAGNNLTLAGPLAAAALGTVFGGIGLNPSATAGLLGALNESTVAVGTLFGLYGARQSSKTMDAHGKDIQDFGMIPLHRTSESEITDPKEALAEDRRLRVTIGISGLLTAPEETVDDWKFLGSETEAYTMRWELDVLTKVGHSLETLVNGPAWRVAKEEIGERTVFDRLKQAVWPFNLMKVSKTIENPWCNGMVRAEKAGTVLADVLMNRIYGERPVTLIGYGLGARVVYSCLMTLSEKRAFGLIENVVMMGAPCPSEVRTWAALKSVVHGRLVNVYCKNDYILGFLSRSGNWQYGIAGLQTVQGVPGIRNVDVSGILTNHLQYPHVLGTILKWIGWEDLDYAQIATQEKKLNAQLKQDNKFDKEREVDEMPAEVPSKGQKGQKGPKGPKEKKGDADIRGLTGKMKGAKLGKK